MDENPYPFSAEPIEIQYTFESISDEKIVKKVVRLTETQLPDIYNLALPDLLEDGQESEVL